MAGSVNILFGFTYKSEGGFAAHTLSKSAACLDTIAFYSRTLIYTFRNLSSQLAYKSIFQVLDLMDLAITRTTVKLTQRLPC